MASSEEAYIKLKWKTLITYSKEEKCEFCAKICSILIYVPLIFNVFECYFKFIYEFINRISCPFFLYIKLTLRKLQNSILMLVLLVFATPINISTCARSIFDRPLGLSKSSHDLYRSYQFYFLNLCQDIKCTSFTAVCISNY